MPTPTKIAVVERATDRFKTAVAVYFMNYSGLSGDQATRLRALLREKNIEFKVIKNTLTRIAAEKAGLDDVESFLQGQIGLAFTDEDPTTPARVFSEFAGSNDDKPVVTGIILEGQMLDASKMTQLANLPPREVLLSRLITGLSQPISQLASLLNGPMTKLAQTITRFNEQKSQ